MPCLGYGWCMAVTGSTGKQSVLACVLNIGAIRAQDSSKVSRNEPSVPSQ